MVAPNSPAHRAGDLQSGDVLAAINGVDVGTTAIEVITNVISNQPEDSLTISVLRSVVASRSFALAHGWPA
jgi:C-terminal processing protease CtpA/Prc